MLLKTSSCGGMEENGNPSQLKSLLFFNHRGARLHFLKRFRVAALRKMSTPLSYNHTFYKSLRTSPVLLKTMSHSSIEENANPSQLQSLLLRDVEGLACTFENDCA